MFRRINNFKYLNTIYLTFQTGLLGKKENSTLGQFISAQVGQFMSAPTPDSDLDLLVVVKESHEPRYRRAQRAQRLLSDIRVPKDVIVMTAEEWEFEEKMTCSLGSTVRREDVLLYE